MNCSTMSVRSAGGKVDTKAKPVYRLYVWRLNDGSLAFDEIVDKNHNQCRKWYEYFYQVVGKTAVVYCFFNDYEILNPELIRVATIFMKGEYLIHKIDLNNLGETIEKGVSKLIHPHH